jgi:SAM-dependent MidA family methyltransferase
LFGAVIARALDAWWIDLGRPDPFVVIEAGAGVGTLAAAVLAAEPDCVVALRYVTVERSPALRAEQRARLPLEEPAFVLGVSDHPEEDEEARPRPGQGPLVTALAEMPAVPVEGVILANELLDNLGFRLLERGAEGWSEVLVGGGSDGLREVVVAAPPELAAAADELVPDAAVGARVPIQRQAQEWVLAATALVQRGRVVAIDYGSETPALAARPWHEWVRTYRGQGRGGHPLDRPGTQDVTCEVAFDQLARAVEPSAVRSQAAFLAAHGLDDLAAAAAAAWDAGASRGDLEAVRAKSRVSEARALADPAGLGGFTVAEWAVSGRARGARS